MEEALEALHQIPEEIQSLRDEMAGIQAEMTRRMNNCQSKLDKLFDRVYFVVETLEQVRNAGGGERSVPVAREMHPPRLGRGRGRGRGGGGNESFFGTSNPHEVDKQVSDRFFTPSKPPDVVVKQEPGTERDRRPPFYPPNRPNYPHPPGGGGDEGGYNKDNLRNIRPSSERRVPPLPPQIGRISDNEFSQSSSQNIEQTEQQHQPQPRGTKRERPNTPSPEVSPSPPPTPRENFAQVNRNPPPPTPREEPPPTPHPTFDEDDHDTSNFPKAKDVDQPWISHGTQSVMANGVYSKYRCFCGHSAFSEKAMHDHYFKMTVGRKFVCPVCSDKFFFRRAVKEHAKAKHGIDTFHCSLCAVEFNSQQELDHHAKNLETECGRKLATKKQLGDPYYLAQPQNRGPTNYHYQ